MRITRSSESICHKGCNTARRRDHSPEAFPTRRCPAFHLLALAGQPSSGSARLGSVQPVQHCRATDRCLVPGQRHQSRGSSSGGHGGNPPPFVPFSLRLNPPTRLGQRSPADSLRYTDPHLPKLSSLPYPPPVCQAEQALFYYT